MKKLPIEGAGNNGRGKTAARGESDDRSSRCRDGKRPGNSKTGDGKAESRVPSEFWGKQPLYHRGEERLF